MEPVMLGTPSAGFAGSTGTEQVAQRLATTPAAGENPSLCYSTGECLQVTQLSPLLPQPQPSLSRVAHLHSWHCPLPSGVQEAHGHTAHTVQTDARTPARAQGHMPTAVELTPARAPCLLDSHTPQAWSPWLSSTGLQQAAEHCQQLVGPSGRWQPTRRRASHRSPTEGECPVHGGQQWQHLLQGYLWVPATLRRSQSAHLPTSLNQGKRS